MNMMSEYQYTSVNEYKYSLYIKKRMRALLNG